MSDYNGYVRSFKKYRGLLWELIKKGIKLKYRRSYLGIVWTLLEPIMTTIVLSMVFTYLLYRPDRGGIKYPVYILSGRLLYSFFSGATKTALTSIRRNAGMIKKVYVPKYLYPLSGILYNYIIFLISLIVLIGAAFIFKIKPTIHIIECIIPLFFLLLLALGIGMILATVSVFFRDIEYLWSVVLMLIMYASAIFYHAQDAINKAEASGNYLLGWLFKCNPLYGIINTFRETTLLGNPINFTDQYFLMSAGISVVSVLIGFYAFYKNQDKFILHI